MRWDDLVDRYAWADAGEWGEAGTVSVISGKTEDQVIRAFGGDPADSRMTTFAEAVDARIGSLSPDCGTLCVGTVEMGVVAIEWGYHGTIPEIARRASANGGAFFSVHRDVNARHQILRAVDGRVEGMFDPFGLEDATEEERRLEVPDWAADVPFRMETLDAESFALMERTTGIPVDPAWWDVPLRTTLLPPPDTLFADPQAAWLP